MPARRVFVLGTECSPEQVIGLLSTNIFIVLFVLSEKEGNCGV